MKLISEQIKYETDRMPTSTLTSRYQKWFNDYYIRRMEEPTETQQTELMVPGKIYTFSYFPEEKYRDKGVFYAYMPITLILGQKLSQGGNLIPYGINLSFVPPRVRIKIMDAIVRIFNTEYIQPSIERLNTGNEVIRNIPLLYDVACKILEGSGFKFAIRGYRYDNMLSTPRIITYEDWYKINFFGNQYIVNSNARAIYYQYMRAMNDKYTIGRKEEIKLLKIKIKEIKEYLKQNERQTTFS